MMAIAQNPWPAMLQQLLEGRALSQDQAAELMNSWLDSEVPDVMSGALLTAIQAKGVDASELAGMARVLRSAALGETLHLPLLVDTCGTGGDGQSTFNISTAVAFVVSAAGIPVAKHGNRAASSKVGSADVLEAIGINLAAPLDKIRAAVDAVGITFLFAPGWHPAMRAVVPYRKTLKIRTIFNLLGPLVNPLGPTAQVIGVYSASVLPTVATALQLLGVRRGVVLHSREGMDEAGLAAPTDLAVVTDDTVEMIALNPADFGINPAPVSALKGGELADNVAILTNVLQGKATQAQQDAVALNAAIALVMAQAVPDWQTGFTTASTLLSSGAAWDKAQALIAFLKN